MTARAGRPFDAAEVLSVIDEYLAEPLPAAGPTFDEGEPTSGEWTATFGEGFLLVPLWEGEPLTGVYGPEWNAAEDRASGHLVDLTRELDTRWGPHGTVAMHVAMFRKKAGEALPEPFRTLAAKDCYGDLSVWGPVPSPAKARWVALSLNQSDGDAPMIMTALITGTRPALPPEPPPAAPTPP